MPLVEIGIQVSQVVLEFVVNNVPASGVVASCNSPADGEVGLAYTHTFTASGGTPPYTFAIISGSLPPGLTLDGSTGVASGVPTASGTFPFTLQVTDSLSVAGLVNCSITIDPGPSPACNNPPSGEVSVAYTHTFTASGGVPGYTFAIVSGALPPGVTLAGATGIASGTPTLAGTFPFTVQVTDSAGAVGTVNCSIEIDPAPAALCNNPPAGVLNSPYSHTFGASGGTAPYSFAISAGALPTGLNLAASGLVSGTPTALGTFNFTVQVTDSLGAIGTVNCSITINNFGSIRITLRGVKLRRCEPGEPAISEVSELPSVKRAL